MQPFRAVGLQNELQVGVERIERRLRQGGYFNVTNCDAAWLALSGNLYRPGEGLPRPSGPDREAPAGQPGERRLVPRWALSWQPGPAFTAFASWAQGLELGSEAPATAVNAGEVLAPRVTRQVEVGGKGQVGAAFCCSLTAFRAQRPWEFVEPLGSSWAGQVAWVQRGQQTHRGIEAGFQWAPGPATQRHARYTSIDAAGRGSGLAGRDGRQLQYIPRSALHLRLDHRLQSLPSLRYNAAVTARSSKAAMADGAVQGRPAAPSCCAWVRQGPGRYRCKWVASNDPISGHPHRTLGKERMNTTHPGADWFSRITGFAEGPYEATRSRLRVEEGRLVSSLGSERWGVGTLEQPSLASLRSRCAPAGAGRSTVQAIAGDVRALHRDPRFAGALFQVASQFNLLEMVGPDVTPEQGVTRYLHDRTQGPACAMAAGAGTIYRNYLMPVGTGFGQTRDRQVDTAAALQQQLAAEMQLAPQALWTMRNGYLLPSRESLERMGRHLTAATEAGRDALRSQLCIGWHRRVEVTDGDAPRPTVSQAYCSAVPVSYSGLHKALWQPLARLVLEAAYEATLLAACIQCAEEGNAKVLLTRLGGGAFGNDDDWIDAAIRRALSLTEGMGLEVWLVCYGALDDRTRALVAEAAWAAGLPQDRVAGL